MDCGEEKAETSPRAGSPVVNGSGGATNDRRELLGWMMYDWASSAFSTTVITVLLGPYLTALAQAAVGDNGPVLGLGPLGTVTAKSLFPYCISLSVFLQVLVLPMLGAIADYTTLKKPLMAVACYTGVTATCLLFFVTGQRYVLGGLLLIVANVSFGAALVLYNAYLNDIATEDRRDSVSSRGYALGYLGGGLLLAANLAGVLLADTVGLTRELAVRLSLLSAGLWWGGFAIITFRRLRPRGPAKGLPPGASHLVVGMRELVTTFGELRRLPRTFRYLVAYMGFNDGIQTVITVASVFLAQELFVAQGRAADESFLMALVLMVQFVAFLGALLFERVATAIRTKNALLLSLLLWTAIVVYAYAFLRTTGQAWGMGIAIASVLGGSQALSRSLFSQMIPRGREASFFSLYEISERGTSWIGPFVFGLVVAVTDSYRLAILSLIALFAFGIVVLLFTDTDEAIRDARDRAAAEDGGGPVGTDGCPHAEITRP
jgi:UMF1 family MFS transporter